MMTRVLIVSRGAKGITKPRIAVVADNARVRVIVPA
jgi:hypothetical protein